MKVKREDFSVVNGFRILFSVLLLIFSGILILSFLVVVSVPFLVVFTHLYALFSFLFSSQT